MANLLTNLQLLLPKGKQKAGGTSYTPTFNPSRAVLTLPTYRDHLDDLYSTRLTYDSRTLLNTLTRMDPDVSSAIHSYMAIAGSAPLMLYAYDENGVLSTEGTDLANAIVRSVTTTSDYTIGTTTKPQLTQLNDEMRYLTLLRGGPAAELVFDKRYVPTELRLVDPATLAWEEKSPGRYAPTQKPPGSQTTINLDIPTFFTARFHQNPTDIYTYSTFVSSINTIASRQLVINELYRVMQVTGFPRLDVKVLEDVLLRSAPAALRADPQQLREFVAARITELQGYFDGLRSDQAFIHTDAIETKIINDKNPSAGLSITEVIETLDSQNQAALKVMPAVVGKGAGSQVASVEARLFAMSADALNRTVANIWSASLTLAVRLAGFAGRVEASFLPVELRPVTELEPQYTMRASRLRQDLSDGIIDDNEYCMAMYGRPANPGAPALSGTGFMAPGTGAAVDAGAISPNADPLGRSLVGGGANKAVRGNGTQGGGGDKAKAAN